jgi:hypothetical protein
MTTPGGELSRPIGLDGWFRSPGSSSSSARDRAVAFGEQPDRPGRPSQLDQPNQPARPNHPDRPHGFS